MADYRIRLRGGGVEATIAPEGELRLLAEGLEGFGRLDGAVAMAEYALYGGGYPTTRRLGSRRLRLHAELAPRFGTPVYRDLHARLMTLLDPTVDVELYVDMGGGTRLLDVIPAGDGSVEVAHMGEPVAAQLSFLAAEPYFRAAAERHVSFWQAAPMLAFPLNLMAGAGTVSGYYGTTNAARLQNPGERVCGYRLTLTAQNGTVQNPSVTLPGGTLSLTCAIGTDDEVVIDTHPRQKTILVNGTPSLCFTPASVFAPIPRGGSTMTLSAASGIAYLRAELSFTPLYYGCM